MNIENNVLKNINDLIFNFQNNLFDKAIQNINFLLLNNTINEQILQIASYIYFNLNDFNNALIFTNKCIELYKNITNLMNKMNILRKIYLESGDITIKKEIKKTYIEIIHLKKNNLINNFCNFEKNDLYDILNEIDYDILIIGAGLSGSVLAERFSKLLNKKVLIIEKRDHIGGNCYDFINELGILESKYGAHLFHTNFENVWNYISKFDEWIFWEHKVLGKVDNKLIPIPVNINSINSLFNINIKNENEMNEWLNNVQIKYDEIKNSEEMCKSRVGEELYNKLFKYYTKKQWDKYPNELDKSVLERIPVRNNFDDRYFTDKYQYLPKNGYTKVFEKMLLNKNITILLNVDYEIIKEKLDLKNKLMFFTGRIDQYFNYKNLPKLEYRSINFERKNISNIEYFQENSVINYPENNVNYTRIVEYKHFLNQKNFRNINGTTIVYETTSDIGEPYYPVPNDKNKRIYDEYRKLLEEEEKKGVYFVGRLANYKYFNMDQAILNSLELFEKLCKVKYEIVVARYNENLDWLKDYLFITKIYNKGNDEINNSYKIKNVGRESHTYLYHIIQNYDNLADITFFTQGKFDDHTNLNIPYYLDCNGFKCGPISNYLNIDKEGIMIHHGKWKDELDTGKIRKAKLNFIDWWNKYINKPLNNFNYVPGAIFSVKKENILKHSKEYYIELIEQIDDHVNPEEGHYFERCWKYMFI
jgi:UDP-galactopyranose mutase